MDANISTLPLEQEQAISFPTVKSLNLHLFH